ncbi:MAG: pyridoxal-phosphate dependent enzyme, partial [Gammaproteobacteria bacterium]
MTAIEDNLPTLASVREASQRIRPLVHLTPVLESEAISQRVGTKVSFKCENFQKVGAFKFRGACNAVFSLDESQARHG